jgi:NAD(P)-dependent dehydrogenase (short-subunit alcohol dehydrogenase family)
MPASSPAAPPRAVVVTGASTGIGQATALALAARGWRVFAGVRRLADATPLIEAGGAVSALELDVANPDHIAAAAAHVRAELNGAKLGGLVNNAGIALMGPLAVQPMAEIRQQFEVNLFGLIAASQAFAPLLGTDTALTGPAGRIVNISSVGGRVASPFLGAYTATKHAVESVTDSFRRELLPFGIDAIAVGPGAVRTPIWDKSKAHGSASRYADTVWAGPINRFERSMYKAGRTGLPVETIADVIVTALTHPRPKARYAPVPQKFVNFILPTLMSKRSLDGVFGKAFGLLPPRG